MNSLQRGCAAGFQPVGYLVFQKTYSSRSRFLRYQHEQAYLLAKGRPPLPKQPLADVMDMPYSGNKPHPTQKSVAALAPLVRSFSLPGDLVLDPFAGAGVPARQHYWPDANTSASSWTTHATGKPQ